MLTSHCKAWVDCEPQASSHPIQTAQWKVEMEKVNYLGQPNCYRLSNGTVEAIVTTDVGPRILRYGFMGGENVLGEYPDLKVTSELGEWTAYGGHRLWTAPEAMPRTYCPDSLPVESQILGDRTIRLLQPVEPKTAIQKELEVTLDAKSSLLSVRHGITNRGLWDVELAPWAITIMRYGGMTILPQEPFRSHDEYLLPARPMTLWHYTDLSDPRWTFGKNFIRLQTDDTLDAPQKVGIANKQGWAGYWRNETLFLKRVQYQKDARYPDYGCNVETFTAGAFVELETLGPLERLEPGQSAVHHELWSLHANVDLGSSEASLGEALAPIIESRRVRIEA
jgi:hypothetical protein